MTPLILDDVIRQIRELPSLPAVVLELLSSMEQQDIDVHVLAHKIELDQAHGGQDPAHRQFLVLRHAVGSDQHRAGRVRARFSRHPHGGSREAATGLADPACQEAAVRP